MTMFERKLPGEDRDIAEIRAGILAAQTKYAVQEQRPRGRGTHTKGVCVRATFEVFDLATTIPDAGLRERLSRGLFARPGTYEATVRFANAKSSVQPDYKRDVRALSFWIIVPPGVTGPDGQRLDFSMNNAPTFPINDAHAFAVLMRLLSARGVIGRFRAFLSLSPLDILGVLKTIVRGARQERRPSRPYQAMRYWSNVPFQHGAGEVIKYNATPSPDNPAHEMERSESMLRAELLRHVNSDERMSTFSFGVQLLEPSRMRRWWRQRPPWFWVENASVEWKETQCPTHELGRLTLVRGSQLTEEECQAQYIDVTEHCAPGSQPIGSINRARWYAEAASREARLGAAAPRSTVTMAALPVTAAPLTAWAGRLTLGSFLRGVSYVMLLLVGLVTLLAGATSLYLHRGGGMLPKEQIASVAYPSQGWGAGLESERRQTFYYTGQGAGLKDIRYSWFVHLEMPWGKARFADQLDRYGFLLDNQTEHNPDRLPVGFTRHFDRALNEELLDITCAACHTGQIQVTKNGQTRAIRIDGGPANHAFTDSDFGHFLPTLIASMTNTAVNPFKFLRFARKVLGDQYPSGRWALHRELRGVISTFLRVAWNEKTRHLVPTSEGYGRTDALARISNTVFAENLVASNYVVGNGPVSYPPVWNIWKFDWVQYNASVSQPMARNIGESMGVGAKYAFVDPYGKPLPPEQRFRATSLIDNLHVIETTLHKLRPPTWQEDILGPIDTARATAGKALFNRHCVGCHGPHIAPDAIKKRNSPLKTAEEPEWLLPALCVDDIGTDPNTAINFVTARVDITRTGLTAPEIRKVARATMETWIQRQTVYLQGEIAQARTRGSLTTVDSLERELAGLRDDMEQTLSGINPAELPIGAALSYLGTMIREKAYEDAGKTPEQRAVLDGFGALDLPQVIAAYKPRPLAGAWASAPFLHNGSVPTIYDLLSPVKDRPATFRMGSREYDTAWLGLYDPSPRGTQRRVLDPQRPGKEEMERYWLFDTSKPGNRNTGHEFDVGYDSTRHDKQVRPGLIGPLLTHDERMAILEHLKVRDDDVDGPRTPSVPWTVNCSIPKR